MFTFFTRFVLFLSFRIRNTKSHFHRLWTGLVFCRLLLMFVITVEFFKCGTFYLLTRHKIRDVKNYFLSPTFTPNLTLLLCKTCQSNIIEIKFLLHSHLRTFWTYSNCRSRSCGFCTALHKNNHHKTSWKALDLVV